MNAHAEMVDQLADHYTKAYDEAGPLDLSNPILQEKPEEYVIHQVANELYSRGREDVATRLLDVFHGFDTEPTKEGQDNASRNH